MTRPIRGDRPPIDDEVLSAWLDGQASPAERDTVEAAIATDPTVRARIRDLRATVTLLQALPQPAPRRTFILTPQQAAAIRPARVRWITRIFPTVAAVSAVAAVLCLMLVVGDLATGGFSSRQLTATPARPAVESVSNQPSVVTSVALPAPTAAAAPTTAAANAPAPAAAATTRPALPLLPAPSAPAGSAATGSFAQAAPTTAPTALANAQPAAPTAAGAPAPAGGAVVTTQTHRVPVALVRAGEIALALLAIAGITLAVLSKRSRAAR